MIWREGGDREVKGEACMIQAKMIKLRIISLVEAADRLQEMTLSCAHSSLENYRNGLFTSGLAGRELRPDAV